MDGKDYKTYSEVLIDSLESMAQKCRDRKSEEPDLYNRDFTFSINAIHNGIHEIIDIIEYVQQGYLEGNIKNPFKHLVEKLAKYEPRQSKIIKEEGPSEGSYTALYNLKDIILAKIKDKESPQEDKLAMLIKNY